MNFEEYMHEVEGGKKKPSQIFDTRACVDGPHTLLTFSSSIKTISSSSFLHLFSSGKIHSHADVTEGDDARGRRAAARGGGAGRRLLLWSGGAPRALPSGEP